METIRFTSAAVVHAEGRRVGLVSCLECGATILLDERDDSSPLDIHRQWHATLAMLQLLL